MTTPRTKELPPTMRILRDAEDSRDHLYQHDGGTLPQSEDLRHYLYDVENQRSSEGCAGFAMSTIMEMLLRRHDPSLSMELSPLFVWWNARSLAGDELRNEPVTARVALKAMRTQGICPESTWRFAKSRYFERPSRAAFAAGRRLRIHSYQRCLSVESVRSAVAAELPVFVGIVLREGFGNISGPMATHPRQFVGYRRNETTAGHFMVVVGYRHEGAILANSWGAGFHDWGYVLMPWHVLMDDHFDLWVVTGIEVGLNGRSRTVEFAKPTVAPPTPTPSSKRVGGGRSRRA